MQVFLGDPVQLRVSQQLGDRLAVMDLQVDIVVVTGFGLQPVPPGDWDVLGGEYYDPVNRAALGADRLDIGADLGGDVVFLKGAGEHDDVLGHKRKEADREG